MKREKVNAGYANVVDRYPWRDVEFPSERPY